IGRAASFADKVRAHGRVVTDAIEGAHGPVTVALPGNAMLREQVGQGRDVEAGPLRCDRAAWREHVEYRLWCRARRLVVIILRVRDRAAGVGRHEKEMVRAARAHDRSEVAIEQRKLPGVL